MKRATIQDISDSLNISRITVWKVLNNKEGVSEITKQKIIKKAIEMDYKKLDLNLVNSTLMNTKPLNNISVIVARPETTAFWVRIINQIAKELNQNKFNLIYNPLTSYEENNFELPSAIKNNEVRGIIVINVYNEYAIKQLCNTKIPKVFLDIPHSIPPYNLNSDVILLEGVETIYTITNDIIKKGCESLGFIGDISYSQTMYDRWKGFLKAIEANNIVLNKQYCLTKNIHQDLYKQTITDFLNGLPKMPEAFVCANDYTGYVLINCLKELKLNIPKDILISGYDDNIETTTEENFLTTVQVKNELIGKRLVKQAMYRIENIESDYETIYINSKVVFRKSTELVKKLNL